MGLDIEVYERFDVRVTDIIKGYWHAQKNFAGLTVFIHVFLLTCNLQRTKLRIVPQDEL